MPSSGPDPVEIAPDTLREVLAALIEAQAYVFHPASVTPSATKRVATHRLPRHEFEALTTKLRTATSAVGDALRTART